MKDYKVDDPEFTDVIQITETTDTNHADNINHAPKQIYENTMANKQEIEEVREEAKPEIKTDALSASKWTSAGVYSFESDYPSSDYDLSVEPNGDSVTADQMDEWMNAEPVGCYKSNQIVAIGDVPTSDIPVIVKITKK